MITRLQIATLTMIMILTLSPRQSRSEELQPLSNWPCQNLLFSSSPKDQNALADAFSRVIKYGAERAPSKADYSYTILSRIAQSEKPLNPFGSEDALNLQLGAALSPIISHLSQDSWRLVQATAQALFEALQIQAQSTQQAKKDARVILGLKHVGKLHATHTISTGDILILGDHLIIRRSLTDPSELQLVAFNRRTGEPVSPNKFEDLNLPHHPIGQAPVLHHQGIYQFLLANILVSWDGQNFSTREPGFLGSEGPEKGWMSNGRKQFFVHQGQIFLLIDGKQSASLSERTPQIFRMDSHSRAFAAVHPESKLSKPCLGGMFLQSDSGIYLICFDQKSLKVSSIGIELLRTHDQGYAFRTSYPGDLKQRSEESGLLPLNLYHLGENHRFHLFESTRPVRSDPAFVFDKDALRLWSFDKQKAVLQEVNLPKSLDPENLQQPYHLYKKPLSSLQHDLFMLKVKLYEDLRLIDFGDVVISSSSQSDPNGRTEFEAMHSPSGIGNWISPPFGGIATVRLQKLVSGTELLLEAQHIPEATPLSYLKGYNAKDLPVIDSIEVPPDSSIVYADIESGLVITQRNISSLGDIELSFFTLLREVEPLLAKYSN